ncbi:MAG: amidohydrolase [Chitinophagales bacterium]|nr:amidohydrolase [Chitinophagales bacterium]
MRYLLCLFIIVLIYSCNQQKVDTIIHNATIYTVDSNFTKAEAIAIKDGKIIAIGTNDDILKSYSSKETIDAQGKFLYPGFIDAHSHFVGYGKSLFEVQLYDSKSWNEVIERMKLFAEKNPDEQWIIGRGWDQNKFLDKQFPTNELLNKLFPDKPVLLTRIDGHAAIVNAKALELANIQPNQKINGGHIETNQGKLTGLLIDNAVDIVQSVVPKATMKDFEKWLLAAQQNCFEQGLTTITDCGLMYDDVEKIDVLQKDGKLLTKLAILLSDDKKNYDKYLSKGTYKTDKLFVNGFKIYSDGALGSRGACLLEPYSDKQGWYGFLLSSQQHFDSVASILSKTNFQMCTHAIGDSANRTILKIYNKYLQTKNDKRWRIEHAQVVNENDFNLFGLTSVVPSVQPTHATSDMYWAEERLGKIRIKTAYAYKKLLQQNGWLPLGTDFPVEDISPIKTFYAAVVRKDSKGFPANGFEIENALTREEALRGITIWAAKANFLEKETGSLEKGKRADIILLDKDLLHTNENDLLNIKVQAVWSDGKKVFSRK